ncbi:hypothetical protein F442_19687 [Phytophthora nicotianae P10297]|uniref:Uncharacterized protein n=1 Tax=Phytophthora nicotianae P10297 TaxID=1317064 RepID=W2YB70_PHYNI|nr:hypothetical protein F442_19687 [Phytophthora nicotianae P10297]
MTVFHGSRGKSWTVILSSGERSLLHVIRGLFRGEYLGDSTSIPPAEPPTIYRDVRIRPNVEVYFRLSHFALEERLLKVLKRLNDDEDIRRTRAMKSQAARIMLNGPMRRAQDYITASPQQMQSASTLAIAAQQHPSTRKESTAARSSSYMQAKLATR